MAKLTKQQVAKLTSTGWKRLRQTRRFINDYRRPHFYNMSSVDPELKEPMQYVVFQTDIARQKWEDLKSRLTENHAIIHVSTQEQTINEQSAEDLEGVLNAIMQIAEERNGYTIQDALSDGQIVDGYAVLHVRRHSQSWPKVPEYEYLDEVPPQDDDDDDEFTKARKSKQRERFREDDDGKWKETDKSVQERAKLSRARAGSPYEIEVLDTPSFSWLEDRVDNVGVGIWVRRVSYTDYNQALGEDGDEKRIIVDDGKKLRLYEGAAPDKDDPSGGDYDTITVASVWTKDEWYELVSLDDMSADLEDNWELVKAGKHAFGCAPFWIIPASRFNHPDPAMRYLPVLEGVFRLKPHYDKYVALLIAASERHAIPDVYIQRDPRAQTTLTETGQDKTIGTNSAESGVVDGTIQKVDIMVNPALVQSVDMLGAFIQEAAPDTGQAEITGSTQPWTARLGQAQANVKPKELLQSQQRGIRAAMRAITRDMATPVEEGGIGDVVWVYKRDAVGMMGGELVGVHTSEIPTLNIDVSIDATSSAERITLTEHGVSLYERGHILQKSLLEDYMNVPNASEYIYDLTAERIFKTQIEPGLIQQVVAAEVGAQYVVGPDGQVISGAGQVQQPGAVAEQNGWQRAPQPETMGPLTDSAPPQVGMRQPAISAVG